MKILLVEDDALARALLKDILNSSGFEVTACGDAESAWDICQQDPPPLLILDWMLPGMDGLELCRRIRQLPDGDRFVVLMVTSRSEPDDLHSVLAAGADDYLTKPIDRHLFKVRMAIAEKWMQDRTARHAADARLEETLTQLEKTHDDLVAILDHFRAGTAIAAVDGTISFLNQSATNTFFDPAPLSIQGQHWTDLFPFDAATQNQLSDLIETSPEQRLRVPIHVKGARGQHFWMEVEVQDDPRDPRRKIWFFYDVTEVHDLRRQLGQSAHFHDLIGKSQGMQLVYQQIQQIANVDWTVLIEGDTGTGKELVARAIHASSHRRDGPFVAVNCAGLTDSLIGSQLFGHRRGAFTGAVEDHQGFLEAAAGGTLLLDEIGDVPMSIQTSLLRVLQEKEITRLGETTPRKVDVRILAATHRDLNAEVEKESFCQDLLYRLRIARVQLPPLHQRREDIPLLISHFLRETSNTIGKEVKEVNQQAMRLLMDHSWPGNVRELKSAIDFAAIRCTQGIIQPEDLPPEVLTSTTPTTDQPALSETPAAAPRGERERFLDALEQTGGNRTAAARLLGISRATFYRRLDELGLKQ